MKTQPVPHFSYISFEIQRWFDANQYYLACFGSCSHLMKVLPNLLFILTGLSKYFDLS
jgi:hypothetical membrane protein